MIAKLQKQRSIVLVMRRIFILLCFLPAICMATPASAYSASASGMSYFNMTETSSNNIRPFPKWTGMVARFSKQKRVPDSECGKVRWHPCSILDWKAMLNKLRGQPLHYQIDAVNDWSNAHPYVEDMVNWGVEDYWETPYEFMAINGDCEDYAISKYYSLRALGIPTDKLRVIIVQDLNLGGIIHAILGVYDDGDLLILDNQASRVIPAMKIYHYRPIYGINEDHWWAYHPKRG